MSMYRRTIPLVITFCLGFFAIINFFVVEPTLNKIGTDVRNAVIIIGSFAIILGVGNLTLYHGRRIRRRQAGWLYGVLCLVVLYSMIALGWASPSDPTYQYWYSNMLIPLDSTVLSLIAFYTASAAYRAFKARNREALVFLVAAVIVMLGRAPIGGALWSSLPAISSWLMDAPTTAGMRGFLIGVAIGSLSFGLRVLLGRERGYLGAGA
jgi:hypothetical protein